ncbi:MAG: NADH-quinone oxidoreductase subunit C [Myxococcota bacterium]
MSREVVDRLRSAVAEAIVDHHADHGDDTVLVLSEGLVRVATLLRDDPSCAMEMLTDLTAVDYLGQRSPRFEVVYHFYSLSLNHRVRLKVAVDDPQPSVPSLSELWSSALWMEREAFDLYGIQFDGHPDLRRILLYPEFEGHPLRKDYDMEARQPRLPARPGREHL